jgi:hypothetical protein
MLPYKILNISTAMQIKDVLVGFAIFGCQGENITTVGLVFSNIANPASFSGRLPAIVKVKFSECKLHFEKLLFIDKSQ